MNKLSFDVIVVGGGASGTAAGIQSARLGVKTLIIEETPWLGGMITSAGVSAFDGNKYAVGGGIFNEFRKMLEDHYGGPEKTYTGWISLTCFEPKIGAQFLKGMAEKEEHLTVFFNTTFVSSIKENNRITGVKVIRDNEEIIIDTKVVIEATEYGDVLESAGIPYRLGRDSKCDTNEEHAPLEKDFEIQDMTFCAILKKHEKIAPRVIPASVYDKEVFKNSTSVDCDTTDEKFLNHKLHDWDSFITYAALPNDKYLLNWPFRSNDYYPTKEDFYLDLDKRKEYFEKSKKHTLNYVHYMQTVLNHPEWGIADDEFPTEDNLPFIPYIRESRRVKGKYLMVESDVVPAENSFRPRVFKTSIAVGDYFLDHHHSSFFRKPEERLIEELPDNAPFQIPFESLLPESFEGLIAAEKSISVSHIVNGCSRLQPVVMLIGQAAGAAAALSVKKGIDVSGVSVPELQEILLDAGCQLFPYKDLWSEKPEFKAVQKLALSGVFVDKADFNFDGNEIVCEQEIENYLDILNLSIEKNTLTGKTRSEVFKDLYLKLS